MGLLLSPTTAAPQPTGSGGTAQPPQAQPPRGSSHRARNATRGTDTRKRTTAPTESAQPHRRHSTRAGDRRTPHHPQPRTDRAQPPRTATAAQRRTEAARTPGGVQTPTEAQNASQGRREPHGGRAEDGRRGGKPRPDHPKLEETPNFHRQNLTANPCAPMDRPPKNSKVDLWRNFASVSFFKVG